MNSDSYYKDGPQGHTSKVEPNLHADTLHPDLTATDDRSTTVTLVEDFNINDIEIDEGLLAREQLDQETVESYAEEMRRGIRFSPIDIFNDDKRNWLADGWHRYKAAKSINAHSIPANVRQGKRHDALLHAAGANTTHGLRRSNADKRKAVIILLKDEECREWTNRRLAEHAGVDHKTVGKIRKELVASGEIPHMDERMVKRGDQTYTTKTHGSKTSTDKTASGYSASTETAVEPQGTQPESANFNEPTPEDKSDNNQQQSDVRVNPVEEEPVSASDKHESFSDQDQEQGQPENGNDLSKDDHLPETESKEATRQPETETQEANGMEMAHNTCTTSERLKDVVVEAVVQHLEEFPRTPQSIIEKGYQTAWDDIQKWIEHHAKEVAA